MCTIIQIRNGTRSNCHLSRDTFIADFHGEEIGHLLQVSFAEIPRFSYHTNDFFSFDVTARRWFSSATSGLPHVARRFEKRFDFSSFSTCGLKVLCFSTPI
jgi:hypothetical protein